MPYIDKVARERLEWFKNQVNHLEIKSKGELEYLVYLLGLKYLSDKERRYSILHDAVYAIIHSGEELKRQYLDKREDQAIAENGDIFL